VAICDWRLILPAKARAGEAMTILTTVGAPNAALDGEPFAEHLFAAQTLWLCPNLSQQAVWDEFARMRLYE
jgi:hypothetical protein